MAGSQEQPRDVRAVWPLDLDGWPERGVCRTHGGGRKPQGSRRDSKSGCSTTSPMAAVRRDAEIRPRTGRMVRRPFGGSWNDIWRYTTKATMSYYKSNLLAGNHEFKAGFEHTPAAFIQGNGDRGKAGQDPRLHRRRHRPGRHADADRALQLPGHSAEQQHLHQRVWRRHVDDRPPAHARSRRPIEHDSADIPEQAGRQAPGRSPRRPARTRFRSRR